MVGRIIKYKTTSFAANTALAGMPPLELVAGMHAEIYEKVSELKRGGMTYVSTKTIKLSIERDKNSTRDGRHGCFHSAMEERN